MPTNQRIRSIPPINQAVWAFSIGGQVRHPLIMSYADLLRQPSVTLPVSMICTERRSIDTANYTGVPLSALFDYLDLENDPRRRWMVIRAHDSKYTIISVDHLRDHAVLAYAVNGQMLTHEQGFPTRLVIPDFFGFKMLKWVTRLEVANNLYGDDHWSRKQAPFYGRIGMMGMISGHEVLEDGIIRLRGFAYVDTPPITKIEILVDGAYMGTSVPFDPADPYWEIDWIPPYRGGVFNLHVRVEDSRHRQSLYKNEYIFRT